LSIIAGMSTPPTAAVSAMEVPDTPAKNMLVTTLTMASPPRMCPTRAMQKSTIFWDRLV